MLISDENSFPILIESIDPAKSYVQVIQSIGRGLRRAHDKSKVRVYDASKIDYKEYLESLNGDKP